MANTFQLGVDTFGDVTLRPTASRSRRRRCCATSSKRPCSPTSLGLDAFGVGEHHRPDFAISAPEVVLAAIAARTKRILLGSAVTVLSTDEPVRVFQRFSTLDALSNGRAEVILGRGSFTESYPLFGYDLSLRRAVRGQAVALRRAAEGRTGDVERIDPRAARGRADLSADRERDAADLGRRRRQSRVGRPRGALRLPAHARDHRRQPAALQALRRPLSPVARAAGPARRCRSPCIRPATSPPPTSRRGTSCGRTTRR